jgi:hypothetical protein
MVDGAGGGRGAEDGDGVRASVLPREIDEFCSAADASHDEAVELDNPALGSSTYA